MIGSQPKNLSPGRVPMPGAGETPNDDAGTARGAVAGQQFTETLWDYYARHGRGGLPWRQPESDGTYDPYAILVSELMLQQTQVARVIPKFDQFMAAFPTLRALAAAPLAEVIVAWSGLGYNRRAKYLHQAAQQIMTNHDGRLPDDMAGLRQLPGVGAGTAGAIMTYAYNQPAVFIETNVRTVYIHHFFRDRQAVSDSDILPLLEQTLDRTRPRDFYWALMDYGTHLKQTVGNLNKLSKEYTRQSAFQGSKRQIRGAVLRQLTGAALPLKELEQRIVDERLVQVVLELAGEGLIESTNDTYYLKGSVAGRNVPNS